MTARPHLGETCPDCGGKVLPVLDGTPGEDAMRASERGELILGGCMIEDAAFRCGCGATVDDLDDTSAEPFRIEDACVCIDEVRPP